MRSDDQKHVDIPPEQSPSDGSRDRARNIIQTTESLAVLTLPRLLNRHVPDIYRSFAPQSRWKQNPSWVPSFDAAFSPGRNWTNPKEPYPSSLTANTPRDANIIPTAWIPPCRASQSLPAELAHPATDPNVLRLRGLKVDSVQYRQETQTLFCLVPQVVGIKRYLRHPWNLKQAWITCRSLARSRGRRPIMYYMLQTLGAAGRQFALYRIWKRVVETETTTTEQDAVEVLRIAFRVAGAGAESYDPPQVEERRIREFCAFFILLAKWYGDMASAGPRLKGALGKLEEHAGDVESPKHIDMSLYNSMVDSIYGRRLFVTAEGRLGLGPHAMRPGDVVVVLFGGGARFLLRRRKDHWVLVGEAWVDGLMEGQMIEEYKTGVRAAEWFDIH